jgi:hypothetical protein
MPTYVDDVVQNLYTKFLTRKTLQNFDPNFKGCPQISTYLYPIVHNMVKNMHKENEFQVENHRYKITRSDYPWYNQQDGYDYEEIEFAVNQEGLEVKYENRLYSNYVNEQVDGLECDLNLFEKYLKKMNRTYKLNRRKCKEVESNGLSLLDVFKFMRQGYTNRDIALKYGTSVTFITALKNKIKILLIEYGIVYGSPKKTRFYQKIFSAS